MEDEPTGLRRQSLVEWHCIIDGSGKIGLPAPLQQWFREGYKLRYFPDDGALCGYLASEDVPHGTEVLHLDDQRRLAIPGTLMQQSGIAGSRWRSRHLELF